jgi:uncharacterized protein YqeY
MDGSQMDEPNLKTRIREETTAAMKSGDKLRVGALRLLSAAITNREKELRHELSDDEVREVAGREVKKRAESIEAFEGAGRTELADKAKAERDVISVYAPEQLDDAAVDALVDEAIASTGAVSVKEVGRVMGAVMAEAKGRVDGKVVQEKVRARLEA